jgi:peptide/nickel transport system substrate-binding protein/oligopeptide transport system substrate-binding protein
MKKKFVLPITALVIVLLVTGILLSGPAATEQPKGGGTFRSYLTSEPSNLDPARGVDVNEGIVQAKIFDGLVQYDQTMKLVGNLAESWEITNEGKTYLFRLKTGVAFHDGNLFSAQDVVFSFNRLLDPETKSPRTWVLEKVVGAQERLAGKAGNVAGISAVDDFTVKIDLVEPFAPFLSLLSMPAAFILPSGDAAAMRNPAFFEKPVGTGPFQVKERERDSFVLLTANSNYHLGRPLVDAIELRVITDGMKAEMEFESGNIDMLQLFPTNYDRFQSKPEFRSRIHEVPALNVFYIGFNNQAAPFNDVRIRRALNCLLNRKAIIDAVFSGRGIPARGSIPPGISGFSEGLKGYEYDPEMGVALLREAGFSAKRPLKFELFQRTSQSAFEITRLIQGELKKHGVEVVLRPMEWSALKDAVNKGEAPAFYMSWFGDYPDGENFLYPLFHSGNWGSGGNRARYKNEKVDAMLASALRIQDEKKRAEAYSLVNQIVVEEAPWLYLWHSNESYLLGKNVAAIEFSPLFSVDKGLMVRMHR